MNIRAAVCAHRSFSFSHVGSPQLERTILGLKNADTFVCVAFGASWEPRVMPQAPSFQPWGLEAFFGSLWDAGCSQQLFRAGFSPLRRNLGGQAFLVVSKGRQRTFCAQTRGT